MLLLKLILTPAIIAGATLVQRRWGNSIGGVVVGLPLTAAPIHLFLALEQGTAFTAQSAAAALLGQVPLVGFNLAYGWTARYAGATVACTSGLAAYLSLAALCSLVTLPLVIAFSVVLASLCAVLAVMWRPSEGVAFRIPLKGETVWRIAAATTVVTVLTSLAESLGPRLSGLLAPFPVVTGFIAVFTHRFQGAAAAAHFLRGSVSGVTTTVVFFLILAGTIEHLPMSLSFAAAIAASACVMVVVLHDFGPAAVMSRIHGNVARHRTSLQAPVSRDSAEHYRWGNSCDGWHLLKAPGVSVIEERMPPGTSESPHSHRVARQLFYVLEGRLIIEIGGQRMEVNAREGMPVEPGVAHQVRNEGPGHAEFLVVSQPPSHGDRQPAPPAL